MSRQRGGLSVLAAALALLGTGSMARSWATGSLAVFDASGREVGPVVDLADGAPVVVVESGGQRGLVRVGRDGFRSPPLSGPFFVLNNCTGPPLLLDFFETLAPGADVAPLFPLTGLLDQHLLLIAAGDATSTLVHSQSNPPPPCAPIMGGSVLAVAPSTPFVDLAGFAPPFALRAGVTGQRHPVRRVVVRDAAGHPLGAVVGGLLPQFATVPLRLPGAPVDPVVLDGHRIAFGTAQVVFISNNCTGPAYLLDESKGRPRLARLTGVGPGDRLLVQDGPPITASFGSLWSAPLAVPCRTVLPGPPAVLAPTAVLLEPGAPAPPFTAQVEAGQGLGEREPPIGLVAVDAAGRALGSAYPDVGEQTLGEVQVLLGSGRTVGLARFRGHGAVGGSHPAWFEAADCSGPALIRAPGPTNLEGLVPATALGPGAVLWVASGGLSMRTLQSSWDGLQEACQPNLPVSAQTLVTELLRDLGPLSMPISLR